MTASWLTLSSERTLSRPPQILPVEELVRPLWSVIIPVYNGGRYLRETLESVMRQAPDGNEMQIEVIDDCSTDIDVQAMVSAVGKGKIGYYRQPYNVGTLRNLETCLNISRGHYIHILPCDDIVHDGFYNELGELFSTYEEVGAAFCRCGYINEQSKVTEYPDVEGPVPCVLENWLQRICERKRIQYVNIAVKREAYETLGGFYAVSYNEDWEMWARIATRYAVAYTPRVLASYRAHFNSVTGELLRTGQNLIDTEVVLKKINSFLPKEQQVKSLRKARKHCAYAAVKLTRKMWIQNKNTDGIFTQLSKAWTMHKDFIHAWEICKLSVRVILNK